MTQETPESTLTFWFSDRVMPHHFNNTPTFDQLLRDRFLESYDRALAGGLDGWKETPLGSLALIIILDQFPRNMFRNMPEAFAADHLALAISRAVVETGEDKMIPTGQRAFLYMPFMHSEYLSDQNISVELYEDLGVESNLKFAIAHRDVIARFGRFPHRNIILGRPSTPEEQTYLDSPNAGF